MHNAHSRVSDTILLLCGLLAGLMASLMTACVPATSTSGGSTPVGSPIPALTVTAFQPINWTETLTPLPSETPLPTETPTPTATATITPTPEPLGCQQPPDDYTRVEVNGWTINRRTQAMLEHAQELYGGELNVTGYGITQGSYHDNGAASWGTHLGGGAVDISVMRKGTYTVLFKEIDPLLRALRAAGFAAWMRTYGELSPDSPYHIHAIAIGDRELSQPAEDQLTGKFGYLRGYNGVPIPDGPPAPDRYGPPILCQWMIDLGYRDLRGEAIQP